MSATSCRAMNGSERCTTAAMNGRAAARRARAARRADVWGNHRRVATGPKMGSVRWGRGPALRPVGAAEGARRRWWKSPTESARAWLLRARRIVGARWRSASPNTAIRTIVTASPFGFSHPSATYQPSCRGSGMLGSLPVRGRRPAFEPGHPSAARPVGRAEGSEPEVVEAVEVGCGGTHPNGRRSSPRGRGSPIVYAQSTDLHMS